MEAPRASEVEVPSFVSAAALQGDGCVSSGDAMFDHALGGGFTCRNVTEVYGEAGSGKTQLLLQAACSAASRGENVLFCVSEPIPQNRLAQLAAFHASCSGNAVSSSGILERILISRVPSEEHLLSVLSQSGPAARLCTSVAETSGPPGRPGVRLVLLDSIAATCSSGAHQDAERVGCGLRTFAQKFGVAVVVSNQVRQRPGDRQPVATLGLGWANTVHTRINLSRLGGGEGRRLCQSVFSPTQPPFRLEYRIDNAGVHFYHHHP